MAASGRRAGVVDTERVNYLASKVIKGLNDIILDDKVSYEEYNALKAWLIKVGADGAVAAVSRRLARALRRRSRQLRPRRIQGYHRGSLLHRRIARIALERNDSHARR